jgi:hypothetical protein
MLVPLSPDECVDILVRTYQNSRDKVGLDHASSVRLAAYTHGVDPVKAEVAINSRTAGDTFPEEWVK